MDGLLNPVGNVPEIIREAFRSGFVDGAISSLQRISAGATYDPEAAMEKAWNASRAKELAEIFVPQGVAND